MRSALYAIVTAVFSLTSANAQTASCTGSALSDVRGLRNGKILEDGTILGISNLHINIDGYAKAYHPRNAVAGALIHLCNAGEVFLRNGTRYHGSVDNSTCTGRFMNDVARIRDAGWRDPSVGLVRWYGIFGKGEARIRGQRVKGIEPVFQENGSGFFVSPTSFADQILTNAADQRRYVNPLRVPAAVVPSSSFLTERGVVMGSFGVAIDRRTRVPVPFVVGDAGPRVGEGTPALARSLAGLPITDDVTRRNRFAGQVDEARVLWVFFGSTIPPAKYNHMDEQALVRSAKDAFSRWGGTARLDRCLH